MLTLLETEKKVRLSESGRPDYLNLECCEMLVCRYFSRTQKDEWREIPCTTLVEAQKLYDGLAERAKEIEKVWWYIEDNDPSLIITISAS